MSRFMILYRDKHRQPKQVVVDDRSNLQMPFGTSAENIIMDLPDYSGDHGGAFIIALTDDPADDPVVIDSRLDQEIEREFVLV